MAPPDRIVRDPNVLGGKAVVRGTRVTVELVLGMLAEGMSEERICRSYPRLTPEDVRACAAYAVAAVRREQEHRPSAA